MAVNHTDNRDIESHPLVICLDAAVPLRIRELAVRGGPTDVDFERVKGYADNIASRADVLMFGGSKKKGEIARLFNELADALAVMAFVPGGVSVFGRRYKAVPRRMMK